MRLPVGEYIRQLRRQRSLTQTELGGEHFSKSYVSAVERDKIVPSHDALSFFAEQLGQPVEVFEQLVQEVGQIKPAFSAMDTYLSSDDENDQEVVALLDFVLQGQERFGSSLSDIVDDLSLEANIYPSQQKRARYAFLKGLRAQNNNDLVTAQSCFEYALALTPTEYQPALLDALGTNFYLVHAYESALGYHTRAMKLLERREDQDYNLFLYVELHCANDYRSLRAHHEARLHYEQARRYLRATNNIQIAGELYLGLGYCMYASLFQAKSTNYLATPELSPEEIDRSFQFALNFLLQSRTLYQVSGGQKGEFTARLMQAMVLLDFSTWRQKIAQEKLKSDTHVPLLVNCESLLDDAAEQCREVLLGSQATLTSTLTVDQQINIYTALAYFIRVSTQRAALARLGEYHDTARKELSLASHTCKQTLDFLQDQALSWKVIRDTLTSLGSSTSYQIPALPHVPDPPLPPHYNPIASAEIYFACSEVAEELGKASTSFDYAQECRDHSDRFFQLVLSAAHIVTPDIKRDSSYLIRFYQRYTYILEQRLNVDPSDHTTSQKLLDTFNKGLALLQRPASLYENNMSRIYVQ